MRTSIGQMEALRKSSPPSEGKCGGEIFWLSFDAWPVGEKTRSFTVSACNFLIFPPCLTH